MSAFVGSAPSVDSWGVLNSSCGLLLAAIVYAEAFFSWKSLMSTRERLWVSSPSPLVFS